MHWELLLKAPSVSGEQELPDTKLMYIMYLSAPKGADVIRQIIATNKSKRGIRNIPKWNEQIIRTEEGRLGRLFPQINNIETVQKNAKELVNDMKDLTTRDVRYKTIETLLKDLIDAQDFEGIENFLNTDEQHPGKRKRAVSTNINDVKRLIMNNPPDKYIHTYYYLTTTTSVSIMDDDTRGKTITSPVNFSDVDLPNPKFSTTDLGPQLRAWARISNGKLMFVKKTGVFAGKIPPYVKRALEEVLGKKISLTPSKLVKYIGGDVTPGLEITPVTDSDYNLSVNNAEDVLNYITLLSRLGINSKEFMLGDSPAEFFRTIMKKSDTNTPMVYPALKVILKEASFDVDKWHTTEKGTRDERALSHMRDKMLRQWKVTRTKSRTGEKTTEEDISDLKQQIREGELEAGAYEELRNLFKLSPTERKRVLSKNRDNIADIYDSFIEETNKTVDLAKTLFSEENYDFLVQLEKDIEGEIDTVAELATHFGIAPELSGKIHTTLDDILSNDIMGKSLKISDLFGESMSVGKGMFKYSGRRLSTKSRQKVKEEQVKNPSKNLDNLLEDMDNLFNFLKEHKQTVKPTEKKTLIQALKEMDAGEITVKDFSPSNLVLEDIIEMMCQLNWVFGDKSLIRARNSFIRSIKEKKPKSEIPKFIASFRGKYSEIRTQLVNATQVKIGDMIKSGENVSYYDKLVRNKHKTANFFGRLIDENLIVR